MVNKTFTLSDGNKIPWIGFGTGTALYNQDASAPVKQAIANGFTHLDGAQIYENENSLVRLRMRIYALCTNAWM